jgi:hypothetical protein
VRKVENGTLTGMDPDELRRKALIWQARIAAT